MGKAKNTEGAGSGKSTAVPPKHVHGPRKPRATTSGLELLRETLKLSAEVPVEQVHATAAGEIERLRAEPSRMDRQRALEDSM